MARQTVHLPQTERAKLHEILKRRHGSISEIARRVPSAPSNVTNWLSGRVNSRPIQERVIEMVQIVLREEEKLAAQMSKINSASEAISGASESLEVAQ